MKVSDKLDEHLLPNAGYTNSNTSCTSCELDNEVCYCDIVRSSYELVLEVQEIKKQSHSGLVLKVRNNHTIFSLAHYTPYSHRSIFTHLQQMLLCILNISYYYTTAVVLLISIFHRIISQLPANAKNHCRLMLLYFIVSLQLLVGVCYSIAITDGKNIIPRTLL